VLDRLRTDHGVEPIGDGDGVVEILLVPFDRCGQRGRARKEIDAGEATVAGQRVQADEQFAGAGAEIEQAAGSALALEESQDQRLDRLRRDTAGQLRRAAA
jgi:hypothetical protein